MTTYQINDFIYTNISNEFSNGEIQNTSSMLFDEINFEIEMINNFIRSESCDSILSDASTVIN
jgi:hypothetical protein